MKRINLLLATLCGGITMAQNQLPASLSSESITVQTSSSQAKAYQGPEAIIWSEDFSSGIPSTWTQQGSSANANWEYRGPNTTPNNTQGSRGAFSGVNNNPPTNDPLNSPTASNGFVIFDSGYLDNGGSATSMGMGTAPSPHIGRLITDSIDLSNDNNVVLSFNSYARRFFAIFQVAFSKDGGLSYPDTLEVYPIASVGTNQSTVNGVLTSLNVSNIIGGESNVKLQFIFDGRPGNTNGNGYYFWMLDDIKLESTSSYSLIATPYNGAPTQDIIYNNDGEYPKYGILHNDQIVPIQGDMNIVNDGTSVQTNVKVSIDILNLSNGQVVQTIQSITGCPNLQPGDTCNYSQTLTSSWTPPATPADYALVYRAISDSMSGSNALTSPDTFLVSVKDDLYALHAGKIDNYIGTNSATNDVISIGSIFHLSNEDPDSAGSNKVFLDAVNISLSALSDSTGDISIRIYDTTGFAFNNGFPAGATPLFTRNFSLSSSLVGTNGSYSLLTNGQALDLNTGTYFIIINLFPNATNGVIRLANQGKPAQNGFSTVMQLGDGNWYGGFSSSNTLESPHITLVMSQLSCSNKFATLNINACFNENITSPSGNFTISQSGIYTDTVPTGGCDSIYTLNVNFLPEASDSIQVLVCDTNYISPSGLTLSQSGFYTDTILNGFGCDSIIYINLNVSQSSSATDTLVIDTCSSSYTSPAGNILNQTGFYTEQVSATNGCDSTIFIDLTINPINLSLTSVFNGTGLVSNQVNAQYQWLDCSNGFQPLIGDTNQLFTPSQNGLYAVEIKANGCTDTSACEAISTIGLANEWESAFAIFPNPSTGLINLEAPAGFGAFQLEIYSLKGELLFTKTMTDSEKQTLNLNLKTGNYLLRVYNTKGQSASQNLLIKN